MLKIRKRKLWSETRDVRSAARALRIPVCVRADVVLARVACQRSDDQVAQTFREHKNITVAKLDALQYPAAFEAYALHGSPLMVSRRT